MQERDAYKEQLDAANNANAAAVRNLEALRSTVHQHMSSVMQHTGVSADSLATLAEAIGAHCRALQTENDVLVDKYHDEIATIHREMQELGAQKDTAVNKANRLQEQLVCPCSVFTLDTCPSVSCICDDYVHSEHFLKVVENLFVLV